MTVLFNTETKQITSRHERGYRVLGKPAQPEAPLVQLEYTEDPHPVIHPDTQRVEVTEEVTDTTYHIRRTVVLLTEYERSIRSWLHPTYAIRIEAPAAMALSPEGAMLHAWFSINGFPIELQPSGETVHIYCNEILRQHVQLTAGLPIERNPASVPYLKNTSTGEIHYRPATKALCNIDKITSAVYFTEAEAVEALNMGADGCGHCFNQFNTVKG
jgi:hypothetical protein